MISFHLALLDDKLRERNRRRERLELSILLAYFGGCIGLVLVTFGLLFVIIG
jgi:hypothetical protein